MQMADCPRTTFEELAKALKQNANDQQVKLTDLTATNTT